MKNRTVIGIICLVLALVLCFGVAPFIGRLTDGSVEMVKVKSGVNIAGGSEIKAEDIEKVKGKKSDFEGGLYYTYEEFQTKFYESAEHVIPYAAYELSSGEYIAKSKVSENGIGTDASLFNLDYDKMALSVNVSFSGCLSGKLDKGDIVSAVICSGDSGCSIPDELRYIKVITSTASNGADKDNLESTDDGSFSDAITTVTLEVTEEQAVKLVANDGSVTLALQCKGTNSQAESYLKQQQEILQNMIGG